MIRKIIILLFLTFDFANCGGGAGSATSASSSKGLFSSWAEDGTTFVLDLLGGNFGSFAFTYLMTSQAICDCSVTIGGTQASGNAVMSGCTYRAGTGSGSDPGCAALNASYTYTKPASVLTVCTGGTCNTYR